MKRILKILLVFTGTVLLLVALFIVLLGMGALNGTILKIISGQASKNINGELYLGDLDGRLFSGFTINGILLTRNGDTIFSCKNVSVKYDIVKLLHKTLDISLVIMRNPELNLVQLGDSTWNIMHIMKEGPEQPEDTTTSDWIIKAGKLRITGLSASISSLQKGSVPVHVNANAALAALVSGDSMKFMLDTISIITEDPDFEVVNLSGNINQYGGVMQWDDVSLILPNTVATSYGQFDPDRFSTTGIELNINPLSIEDFRNFIPDMKVYGSPDVTASLKGNKEKLEFDIHVTENKQKMTLSGWFSIRQTDTTYSAEIIAENIDASEWTRNDSLSTSVSGKINIEGTGFDFRKNKVTATGVFENIRYDDYEAGNLMFSMRKNEGQVTGNLNAVTLPGDLNLDYSVTNAFSNPFYNASLNYSNVNLALLTGIDTLQTDLNGQLLVKGKGTSTKDLSVEATLNSFRSDVIGNSIGEFQISGTYNRGLIDFSIPGITTPFFRLSAEGHGNINRNTEMTFSIEPLAIGSLMKGMGMPGAELSGSLNGIVDYSPDSLNAMVNATLDSIYYDSILVSRLDAEMNIKRKGERNSGVFSLKAGKSSYGEYTLNYADVSGEIRDSTLNTEITLNALDSLKLFFSGNITGMNNPVIGIDKLSLSYKGENWSTGNDTATVILNSDNVEVKGFSMKSGNQQLRVDGRYAFKGEENLSFSIDSLDLERLPLQKFTTQNITGSISSGINIEGTSDKPVIRGTLAFDNLTLNEYVLDSLRSHFSYDNEFFEFRGALSQALNDSIGVYARIPMHLSFSDSTFVKKDSEGLSVTASARNIDLKEISGLFPVNGISAAGMAGFSAEITNTINNPVISGAVNIDNGALKYPAYGIDYSNILLSAEMRNDSISIHDFNISSGKGSMNLEASAGINTSDTMRLRNISAAMKANNFQVLKSRMAELNFNSDVSIKGDSSKSGLGGTIRINNSKINMDYVTAMLSKKKDLTDPPLLIAALHDTSTVNSVNDTAVVSATPVKAPMFSDLSGEVVVDIPGNTWITGKDMNFELEGTMRVVLQNMLVNLFGDLNVRRGYYKIYGRTFNFEKGIITFTGGSEFNPDLDFEIVYRFRDIEKELRDLKLAISGKMLEPDLAFSLDNESIEEKDALSYIAFGKSINQLGEGERDKMSGQDIAMGAAVSQLSSVLRNVLQESAGIDVFEFSGGEDWRSGSVTIGKYITNKLFLSYERNFDFNRENRSTAPSSGEKVMLEYQFLRNLILKATNQSVNSGFDLIFRHSWR
ncbi:MAG TPA: translocation/assembly module TamB domain-containing protein [Bacteroidales bacterium]|nr:translocation/assembly module TamB domain-containing protein [Bacteroidales bacterium]